MYGIRLKMPLGACSLPDLNLVRSRRTVEMGARHPIMVQHDGPEYLGTRARTALEMFDRHVLHLIPPTLRLPLRPLLVCASVSGLLPKYLRTASPTANWNYVMVWHHVDDLEGRKV